MTCKPSVNRTRKMVPEGGFEPPTRGFSIPFKASISAALIVNYAKISPIFIRYMANGLQTKIHQFCAAFFSMIAFLKRLWAAYLELLKPCPDCAVADEGMCEECLWWRANK